MKQRTDFYEFIENIYSNCGKEKAEYGEQISKGNGNSGNVRSGIGETDEELVSDK